MLFVGGDQTNREAKHQGGENLQIEDDAENEYEGIPCSSIFCMKMKV
jgi:hypothetical protein